MSNFKDKLQVFFLGLLLGLLLGGGFFLFKLDQYVKELSIYKSFSLHRDQPSSDKDTKNTEGQSQQKSKPVAVVPLTSVQKNALPVHDTLTHARSALQAGMAMQDSIKRVDSVSNSLVGNQDDIVLKKDELIGNLDVELINLSPAAIVMHDSLAAKMAGVREDHSSLRTFCPVELWSSPLNYRGYKMSPTKIVLYGLTDLGSIKLMMLEGEMYFQYGSSVYHIENTNDFRPFERVNSENTLSKLKLQATR